MVCGNLGYGGSRGVRCPPPILVRQGSSIFQPNCAFCEESTKFGTLVEYHSMNRFVYWARSNSASDVCGSHFSKWPTAVTVMMHISFTGGMQVDGEILFTNKGPIMVKKK